MGKNIDGAHLKRVIKEAGYTLDEFYKELGVAKTTFYRYRLGRSPIPQRLRRRIEELLGCSFHTFLTSKDAKLLALQEKVPTSQRPHA